MMEKFQVNDFRLCIPLSEPYRIEMGFFNIKPVGKVTPKLLISGLLPTPSTHSAPCFQEPLQLVSEQRYNLSLSHGDIAITFALH
jgi:hypothetical protein